MSFFNGIQMNTILIWALVAVVFVLAALLILSVRKNKKLSAMDAYTASQELEYQKLLTKAMSGIYENIYELDITNGVACGEGTRQYFESLGIPGDTPYDDALEVIAQKQIKEEFIKDYLNIFKRSHVLRAFRDGVNHLCYDLMISKDRENYHWMRIIGQVFYWQSDQSIRMITYRQNIDSEKRREISLLEKSQRDSLTELYNKRKTEELITRTFKSDMEQEIKHAFLIFDIDNFKGINDNLGHDFGDFVISEFASELKRQFRDTDIVGRIGGDEFVVLMKNYGDRERLCEKLKNVCPKLVRDYVGEKRSYGVSASIGVSLFPQHGTTYTDLYARADEALYFSKGHGKKTFQIYDEASVGLDVSRVNSKDLDELIGTMTDGISKIAFVNKKFRVLYFDKKRTELTDTPAEMMMSPEFDPLTQFHPDDVDAALAVFRQAIETRAPFTVYFRLRYSDGNYFPVRLKGMFVQEQYEGKYPVFYAVYTNLSEIVTKVRTGMIY